MTVAEGVGVNAKKDKPHLVKVIINVLILVSIAACTGIGTSEYLANQFGNASELGERWLFGFYSPWDWMVWYTHWGSLYPDLFHKAASWFVLGMASGLIVFAIIMVLSGRRSKAIEGLHGTAKWATDKAVEKSGLLNDVGVFVGAYINKKKVKQYLRHWGAEHIMAFAPTRSGKGVGLVIPTLLTWKESLFCYDIKGENWALTAGWRKRYAKNKVMKFEPACNDGSSVHFNPLNEIRLNTEFEVSDAQNIALMLVDSDGKGIEGDHWRSTAYALLTASIIHCCYMMDKEQGRTANLTDVGEWLSNPMMSIDEVLEFMLTYEHTDRPHRLVAQEARAMLNKDERELSGVVSTAVTSLTLYRDPIISENISRSDFSLRDIMNHESPVSLYLVVSPKDAPRIRPLTRLVISMLVRECAAKMEFSQGENTKAYKHKMLMMLDEFASLKRLSVIEDSIAYLGGYGVKLYLIVQDIKQIIANYGRDDGIIGNCHIRVAYAPNQLETAELLSKMSGTSTVVRKKISLSGKRFKQNLDHVTEHMDEVSRPLITPDEVLRLPAPEKDENDRITKAGKMLIFSAGHDPILGEQVLFFKDETLLERSKVSAPVESDALIQWSDSGSIESFSLDGLA
ncbi:type IV secretory system conjugative DNA transfer family protein [Vibrio parahaemolyticus]|nr:type IV secretory system conjugative DNA transfer family protein [Vibrio parahaemolyticus]